MDSTTGPLWFGQYRLSSRIATGGMAEIYVGRQVSPDGVFGPMVAVKRLLPHLTKDNEIVRMFLNEARITSQIHHHNVVKIVDLGQHEGEPFIAMELLEGRTFAELRQKLAEEGKRLPISLALRILIDACRGLDAAHHSTDEHGQPMQLVHRDFTPDNIHVGVRGDVKVIDFGVARTSTWASGTEPGTLKGKFFYMSPEMILSRPVDLRADIFAAGVMLYEQLCGRRPFTGTTPQEVLKKIVSGKPPAPRTFDPAVPLILESVALRALAQEPEARFASLGEMADAMESVAAEIQLADSGALGGYVATVFPEDKDPRRQTLKRAREADPSIPNLPVVRDRLVEAPAPIPLVQTVPPDAVTRQDRPIPGAPKPPSRAPLFVGLAVVVALLVGGGAFWWKESAATSAQLLERASKATDAQTRADALRQLSKKTDLTGPQLKAANALAASNKSWDLALELAEAWGRAEPKSADAAFAEARAATLLRKGKKAESAIARAAELDPSRSDGDLLLADLKALQGDSSGELDALARANKKRPGDAPLAARYGYALSQSGRLDEAERILSPLGTRADALAELGFVKYRRGAHGEAATLFRRALKLDPKLMVAHYYLGAALYAQGDTKAARAAYVTASELSAEDPRPLEALCELDTREKSPSLGATREDIKRRFGKDAEAILKRCAP